MPGIWANYHYISAIHGADQTFGRNAYDEFYHNVRTFWDITPNISGEYALLPGLKLLGSAGAPLLQHSHNVDDIQLNLTWFAQLGIQGSF
jgi:hypothetical protein